jgi:H+-transporting ATPase
VRQGQAFAEVTATGDRTYFGRTAELVRGAHATSTEQRAIFAATRNLAFVNGSIALLVVAGAFATGFAAADVLQLALTALLATIPVALPATFTLSGALTAQLLARKGVLLTRLSAAHEAAATDVLCADKTGTLTQASLDVAEVVPMAGFDRGRVLMLAALASSAAGQDPIDIAVRRAAATTPQITTTEQVQRFTPFDPTPQTAEAVVAGDRGQPEFRVVKGAFAAVTALTHPSSEIRQVVDDLARRGNRVIAVAVGEPGALALAGLVALGDPPRADSARLISDLHEAGVRTIMVTGDSAVTAAAIAAKVGMDSAACPTDRIADDLSVDKYSVFARVLPDQKFGLVKALQRQGHVVGMCGDGVNDAPALRQAQIGIAVSTATDAAKAAAGMVLTEPGLAGVVSAIREGRVGFQRLLTYTFNMMVKKIEIVLFLATGLALTGQAILTPALMVLLLMTNDFLAMSLTTDRATPASGPSAWRMPNITGAAILLGVCKLVFSIAAVEVGACWLKLGQAQLQTLAFVTLVFGAQALLYVIRERRHLWSSRPSVWLLLSSLVDVGLVSVLALAGTLMAPLSWQVILALFAAAAAFSLLLDQIKRPVMALFKVGVLG